MKNKTVWTAMSVMVLIICTIIVSCKDKNNEQNTISLSAYESSGKVYLSWSSVDNIYEYEIMRSSDNQNLSYYNSSYDESYTDNNPLDGTNYYQILAKSYDGMAIAKSNIASCYVQSSGSGSGSGSSTLSAPTGVSAIKNSSSITVSWYSVSGASSYKVYRASSASGTYSLKTTTTSTSYTDNSPLNGMNYYKVTAVGSNSNESAYSNYCSCDYSSSSSTTLSAPTNVTANNTGSAMVPNISISWNAVTGASSYNIYRASSASGSYSKIGSSNYTFYSDSNPLNGTNYYKVTAVNSSGKESEKSSYASASYDKDAVSPCPPSFTSHTANASTNKLTIQWAYSTSSGCGQPTSVEVKIYEPSASKWITVETYTASTKTHTFYYGMYQDSEGWVKMGIIVKNAYGEASKTLIYNTKTKQWI